MKLGFGTAPVLGRIGAKQSRSAILSALELGIRHFDTARSYGWGEAEGLLGELLSGRPRDSYTLVSKCGILPVKRSPWLSLLKSAARAVYHRLPASQALVRRAASASSFRPARTYDVPTLRRSLDESLRALRTDHLDILLLHNFEVGRPLDEVVQWFQRERQAGRILRYGFSVECELTSGLEYIAQQGALEGAVVQVPVSQALLTLPPAWRSVPFIAHSAFRFLGEHPDKSLGELVERLTTSCACEALVASMFSRAHQLANLRVLSDASRGPESRPA